MQIQNILLKGRYSENPGEKKQSRQKNFLHVVRRKMETNI